MNSSTVRPAPLARGVPLLGSLPLVSRLGMLEFLRQQWLAHGDTFRIKLGPRSMVVVVHPDGVERILASHRENYVKGKTYDAIRLLTGEGLLTLEGTAWMKRRRLEQPAFHRESIRRLTATMVETTQETLARWREALPRGGTVEAHREMMNLTLEVVGATLFGQNLGSTRADASGRAFGEALSLISERGNAGFSLPLAIPTPKNRRLKKAIRALDEATYGIIAHGRAAPADGQTPTLLSMLLSARDADTGEGLTDLELRNEVITLFLAGHETTALLLTWAFTLLGPHPEVVQRMREEVDTVLSGRPPTAEDLPRLVYVRQVIDEVLRLRSPTWAVARDTVKDDVVCGFQVRRGDTVLPVSYLTHRHPRFWEAPEAFDPERFSPARSKGRNPWSYFPFSLGQRMCIGNIFSLVEAQVVLALLLQQAEFQLSSPAPVPDAQVTLRPTAPVEVAIRWRDARSPASGPAPARAIA